MREIEKRCDISQKISAYEERIKFKLDGCVGRKEMYDTLIKLNDNFESSWKKTELEMQQFWQVIKDMKESVITKASSEELINTCLCRVL